jgi:sporulation protein YlmC with PRC-barrel domain
MKSLLGIVLVVSIVTVPLAACAQSSAAPRPPQPVWRELGLSEARNVLGMRVRNEQGRDVGEIDNLLIDTQTGQISYVVVAVGGFMGVGEKKVVVPWSDLTIASDGKRAIATLSQTKLDGAPRWDRLVGDGERAAPSASPGTER